MTTANLRVKIDRESTALRRKRITEMTQQGLSSPEIAAMLGMSERSVTRARVLCECTLGEAAVPATDDERRRALELLTDGCSYMETARTIGRSSTAVRRWFPGYEWTAAQCGEMAAMMRKLNRLPAHLRDL